MNTIFGMRQMMIWLRKRFGKKGWNHTQMIQIMQRQEYQIFSNGILMYPFTCHILPNVTIMFQQKTDLLPALIKDDSFAAYGNSLSMKSYDLYKKCEVIALPKQYGHSQMGFTVPKNSSLKSPFTFFITQLIESGTIDRFKTIYDKQEQVCPSYEGKPIGIPKFFSVIGIFLVGVGLSFLWFL